MSEQPPSPTPSAAADPISAAVAPGYAFEGPALELGGLMLDATTLGGVPHPDPAGHAQPARARRRRDRHRQDQDPPAAGRAAVSAAGVPVFAADIKGDLSGLSVPGAGEPQARPRAPPRSARTGRPQGFPVEFFALGGQGTGIPLRVTMTAFGPTLLSKVLGLNDTQESSLGLVFHYADQAGLPLLDLADLREVVKYLTSDEGKADLKDLGGLSAATAGVILRELIALLRPGRRRVLRRARVRHQRLPADDADGKGLISLVELPNLQDRPAVFSTFLMWLLADLFHDLPEVGDVDKPKLVFFFDEAHLLFSDASKAFLDAIAQTVRLIRSKGVGVFFVTQSPDRRARRRARPARLPRPAPAARAHAERRQGAQADGEHLPALGVRRPRPGDPRARHRRGDRDGDERARRPDAGRVDPAARARVVDGGRRPPPAMDAAVKASPLLREVRRGVDRESAREKLAAKLEHGADPGRRPSRAIRRRCRLRRPLLVVGHPSRRSRWSSRSSPRRRSSRSPARPRARSSAGCSAPAAAAEDRTGRSGT